MEENKPQKPLSIVEAGNYLKEQSDDTVMKANIKKDIDKAQISVAPPRDRINYIAYALNFLTNVSPEVEKAFLEITGTISSSISRSDIAKLLRKIMVCRVNGYSVQAIAHHLKEQPKIIETLEKLAVVAVGEEMERHKVTNIPIIGN